MAYNVNLANRVITIWKDTAGPYRDIAEARSAADAKRKVLVVEQVIAGLVNGQNIDFDTIGDERLEELLDELHQQAQEISEQRTKAQQMSGDVADWAPAVVDEACKDLILTTETIISDLNIEKRLEVISAGVIFSMDALADSPGGRSKAVQDKLRDARKTVLTELRREALMSGANAVVGVSLDCSEVPGGETGSLLLLASGTGVRLRKK